MLAKYCHEVAVSIALMQEDRLSDTRGDPQLLGECRALHISWREIAEVVEPAFADGHGLRPACELFKLAKQGWRQLGGVMRMHAGSREQSPLVLQREPRGLVRTQTTGAGHHHLRHTCSGRSGHHGVTV